MIETLFSGKSLHTHFSARLLADVFGVNARSNFLAFPMMKRDYSPIVKNLPALA